MLKKDIQIIDLFIHSFIFSTVVTALFTLIAGSPPQIHDTIYYSFVPWQRPGVFKTYDLRNYVLGIIIFALSPFAIASVKKIFGKYFARIRLSKLSIILLSLLGIFCVVLMGIIIVHNHPALIYKLTTKERGRQIITNGFYFILSCFLFIGVYLWIKNNWFTGIKKTAISSYVNRLIRFFVIKEYKTTHKLAVDILMCVLILFIIFNPKYKFSYESIAKYGGEQAYQFHHVISFIGPINEVFRGKSLMVDTQAQYGILATYIPAILFRFTSLTFSNFVLYVMVLSVIYSIFLYSFLRIISRRIVLPVISVVLYMKLFYFGRPYIPDVFVYPSSTPLRFFFDIISMISVYYLSRKFSTTGAIFTGIIISMSLFYNLEIGIPLTGAYLTAMAIDLFPKINKRNRFFASLFFFIVSVFIWVSLLNVVTFMRSGQLPDWIRAARSALAFGKGFFDIPMPIIGAYYFPIAIYAVTYYIIIVKLLKQKYNNIRLLVFILVYGLLSFTYYLNFNVYDHLLSVIHPALILAFMHIDWLMKNPKIWKKFSVHQRSIAVCGIMLIVLYMTWAPNKFIFEFTGRLSKWYGSPAKLYHKWNYPGTDFYLSDNNGNDFSLAARKISQYDGGSEKAVILSRYDTLLYIMSEKSSLLDFSYLEYEPFYVDDIRRITDGIITKKPEYIFVYSDKYNQQQYGSFSLMWNAVKSRYSFVEHGGVIDVYHYTADKKT